MSYRCKSYNPESANYDHDRAPSARDQVRTFKADVQVDWIEKLVSFGDAPFNCLLHGKLGTKAPTLTSHYS